MDVELISVGTELLDGHHLDSNSLDLARRLTDLGCRIRSRVILPDETEHLAGEIRTAAHRSDLVVVTGGLGPTRDDLTREALAHAAGLSLVTDPEALERIHRRYRDRDRPVPEGADRQARRPEGADLLPNRVGTAPGLLLRLGRARVATLPGVPREMWPMFEKQLLPRIKEILPTRALARGVFKIAGLTESEVDERLGTMDHPALAGVSLLAAPGLVEIHLHVSAESANEARQALDDSQGLLVERFGDDLFGRDEDTLVSVVGDLLRDRGETLATAESCTGGTMARLLTDLPGSSTFFLGGVVAYSDQLKQEYLGVPGESLERYGAVSTEVAAAMASGALARTGATHAVSITGIAGPEGGSVDKPVGLTLVGVTGRGTTAVRRFVFPGDRNIIRLRAARASLDLLRRRLLGLALPGEGE